MATAKYTYYITDIKGLKDNFVEYALVEKRLCEKDSTYDFYESKVIVDVMKRNVVEFRTNYESSVPKEYIFSPVGWISYFESDIPVDLVHGDIDTLLGMTSAYHIIKRV